MTAFFDDVKNAGIQNVTITFAVDQYPNYTVPRAQAKSPKGPCSVPGNCCVDTPDPVYFGPTEPFGLKPAGSGFYPIGQFEPYSLGYDCAPINDQHFVGWNNLFDVINAVLGAARGRVTVYELEMQQELNTMAFTVLLRWIYDNSIPESAGLQHGQKVDIVSRLRSLMSANTFDPGRVTWSAVGEEASSATDNCTNIYTDWSRNFRLDSVASAIGGGWIGLNREGGGGYDQYGLWCGGTLAGMFASPIYNTQPNIVDTHIYPQVIGAGTGDTQIQQVAALDYGDLPHFLILVGLQSAPVIIGETYAGKIYTGYSQDGSLCWNSPTTAPASNVAGYNQSQLAGHTIIFRPWMQLEDPSGWCFAYGGGPSSPDNYQNVNYNWQGPYTPTLW